MRQPFSGTAERIFMKLLPNDSGENGVSNAVPKWGLAPLIIFWGLKTEKSRKIAIGAYAILNFDPKTPMNDTIEKLGIFAMPGE